MVVRIKLLSPLECKGHTLLQLLQRVFCRMLTNYPNGEEENGDKNSPRLLDEPWGNYDFYQPDCSVNVRVPAVPSNNLDKLTDAK